MRIVPLLCFPAVAASLMLASGVSWAQAVPRPFKATVSFSEQLVPSSTASCVLEGEISGQGRSNHIGRLTLASRDCIVPTSATAFSFASSEVVLSAPNGDRIFATYQGFVTQQSGLAAITGGYQITGGTGRFANASGAGSIQGLENVTTEPATGQIQLNGTILY